jgi:OmpA-OmpF porin, OOP family
MNRHGLSSALLVIATIGIQPAAQAEKSQNGHWYLSTSVGYVAGDGARGGDGISASVGVGKIINKHFNIELKGIFNSLGKTYIDQGAVGQKGDCKVTTDLGNYGNPTETCYVDDGRRDDLKLGGGAIDLQYYFYRSTLSPYLVGGLGMLYTDSHTANDGVFGLMAEAGVGATLGFGADSAVKFFSDVRYRYNNNFNNALNFGKDELHDVLLNFGLVWVL